MVSICLKKNKIMKSFLNVSLTSKNILYFPSSSWVLTKKTENQFSKCENMSLGSSTRFKQINKEITFIL